MPPPPPPPLQWPLLSVEAKPFPSPSRTLSRKKQTPKARFKALKREFPPTTSFRRRWREVSFPETTDYLLRAETIRRRAAPAAATRPVPNRTSEEGSGVEAGGGGGGGVGSAPMRKNCSAPSSASG